MRSQLGQCNRVAQPPRLGNRPLKLQQVFTLGRLRSVYDRAATLYALTWWRPDTTLDPGLEQFKGFVGMGLDQFQVWKLFADLSALKGIGVVPILDLIEAIIPAEPSAFDHCLVGSCMSLESNQSIQCPVDANQRSANYPTICEGGYGFPHVFGAGYVIIVRKRGEARRFLVINWVEFADV